MSDFPVYHPFDYFELCVTRDAHAISQKIKEKYDEVERHKTSTTNLHKWQRFLEYANSIGTRDGLDLGNYVPKSAEVEKIVLACLAELEDWFAPMVHPGSKTVHPEQVKLTIDKAHRVLRLDKSLSETHLQNFMRKGGIKIDDKLPPPQAPPPPQPVSNLRIELLDRGVLLRWDKPTSLCDYVVIHRGDWPKGKQENVPGNVWTDDSTKPGERYEYEISSVYGGGAPGGTNRMTVVARGCIDGFKAAPNADEVTISWIVPANAEAHTLYRSDAPIVVSHDPRGVAQLPAHALPVATLSADAKDHVDKRVERGRSYHYCLVARHPNGVTSVSPCVAVSLAPNPPPPREKEVRIIVYPGRVYLAWPASAAGTTYQIERRETPDFNHAADIAKKWIAKSETLEDKDVVSGKCYWYSLRAERNGLASLQATIVGPALAIAEVTELTASSRSREVELTWNPPPNVKRIEVRRGEGGVPDDSPSPTGTRSRGAIVPVASPRKAIDSGLTNNVTYGYRVSCMFAYPDGREVSTIGECVLATPCELPAPVRNLRVRIEQGVLLEWDNPGKVQIQIVRSARSATGSVGDVIPLPNLSGVGQRLPHVKPDGVADPRPSTAEPFYQVFAVNKFHAVYCGQATFIDIEMVQVKVQREAITLEWTWPQGCVAAEWAHRAPGAAGYVTHPVNLGTSPKGTVNVPNCRPGQHAFTVRCQPASDSALLAIGQGWRTTVQVGMATSLRWKLARPKGWLKSIPFFSKPADKAVITANGLLPRLTLQLVGQVNRRPASASDGKTLATLELPAGELPAEGRHVELDVPPEFNGMEVYCRLFSEPDEAVKVIHPLLDRDQML